MSSHVVRILSPNVALACAAVFALTACQRNAEQVGPTDEIAWARAALERNPQLELVASDPQAGVFTVRNRSTGEVQAVKLNELAAAPVSQLQARAAQLTATAPTSARAPETAPAPGVPSEGTRREPSAAAGAPAERVAGAPASAESQVSPSNYTIERSNGQLRVSGPGVSIVSSGISATDAASADARQRAVEPIICEGRRMIHLDSRTLFVDGDAITARGGCELYITNSRIVASGTGVVVKDAVVHISNSHVEGASASFDAADQSRLFVRGSTFQGVPRRTELATVQDQGGNRWR